MGNFDSDEGQHFFSLMQGARLLIHTRTFYSIFWVKGNVLLNLLFIKGNQCIINVIFF